MSDKEAKKDATPSPPKPPLNPVGLLLPAVLAAAASFGGAKVAGAHAAPVAPVHVDHRIDPPGPTIALEPFLVMAPDQAHHTHPMRVTLAVEFGQAVHEEGVRAFIPRIRDAALNYIRGMTYEDATDPVRMDHVRAELLERFRATGALSADRVLVTDLVVQ